MTTLWRIASSLFFVSLVSSGIVSRQNPEDSRYCEFYNRKSCLDSEEACTERKKCPQGKGRNHCFVMWEYNNVTNSSSVILKGCWDKNPQCYDKVECVDTHNDRENAFFCCCDGDSCNHDYSYIPKPTEPTIVIDRGLEDSENSRAASILHQYILIIVLPSSLLLLLIISVSLYLCYRHKRSGINESLPLEIIIHSDSSPRLDLESMQLLEVKARGRFGVVWKAELNDELVAVKVFMKDQIQSFQSESNIFKLPRMNHDDILQFIGSERRGDEFWLITKYQERGSLRDYLKTNVVTWSEMCRIAESMARGLMHLHEEMPADKVNGYKPAVAHRDVKSKNILLKSDMRACIADFGLALVFQPDEPCGDAHGQIGTWRYMAPEVLDGAINFTRDSFLRIDMYAFGLVLWELASRCTAQDGPVGAYRLPFEAQVGMNPTLGDMQEIVAHRKERPLMPETWRKHSGLSAMCDTIEECWDHEGEARLSASCVVERIASLGQNDRVDSSGGIEVDGEIASGDIEVDDVIASGDAKVDEVNASRDIKVDEANHSINNNVNSIQRICCIK